MTNFDFSYTFLNEEKLPLLIQPKPDSSADFNLLIQFLSKNNAFFKEQLLQYGAIKFRGFNINSADQFHAVVSACGLGKLFNYDLCVVPRTKIKEGIYTSVNYHPSIRVALHNEKSYDPVFPSYIYFNCLTAPVTGGNTPLVDGHKLWCSLPSPLQQKLQAKGVMYRQFYYSDGLWVKFIQNIGKGINSTTWMDVFHTENKNDVEHILNKLGRVFRWTSWPKGLIWEKVLPAYRYHPINNKIVWFNQCDHNNQFYNSSLNTINCMIKNPLIRFILSRQPLLPFVACFGDGEPISRKEANIMDLAVQNSMVSTPWEQGDFLVIDNYLCLHGKEPHQGKRLLLAAMTK